MLNRFLRIPQQRRVGLGEIHLKEGEKTKEDSGSREMASCFDILVVLNIEVAQIPGNVLLSKSAQFAQRPPLIRVKTRRLGRVFRIPPSGHIENC